MSDRKFNLAPDAVPSGDTVLDPLLDKDAATADLDAAEAPLGAVSTVQYDDVVIEGIRSAISLYTPDATDRSKRDQYYNRDRYLGEVGSLLHDGNTPPEDFFEAVNGSSNTLE